jgi:1,4-dihydroxy-2-naphthoate octaprenyltransferase
MYSNLYTWLRAARLLSLGNIWPPLLAGWFIALQEGAAGGNLLLALLLVAGWLDQLAIVFLNEVADVSTDHLNQRPTLFSGGSRVLVEGRLPVRRVRQAGLWAGAGFLALAGVAGVLLADGRLPALALAGLLLLQAYSFPPLRLNYRGGGELLQALGCGAVLPALGLLFAGGDLGGLEGGEWLGLVFLALPGALGSTLSDAPADRLAGKETLAANFGATGVALLASGFAGMSLVMLETRLHPWALVGLSVLMALVLGLKASQRVLKVDGSRDHPWNVATALLLLAFTFFGWLALIPWPA